MKIDISYVVNDIRQFTKDHKWVEIFGEILIVQYPMDWYSHPYDYAEKALGYSFDAKEIEEVRAFLLERQRVIF